MRRETDIKLPENIEEYVEHLVNSLTITAVILFGSVARGDDDMYSDYDIFVIAEDLPNDFWRRQDVLWKNKPLGVDVLGFTKDEVKTHINRGLILDVLLEGILLYGNASDLKRGAEDYVLEHNLRRTPAGYVHATA